MIVALFEEEKMSSFVQELDKAFEGQLQVLLEEKELSTKKKAISKVHSLGKTDVKRYYFVGLGKKNLIRQKHYVRLWVRHLKHCK